MTESQLEIDEADGVVSIRIARPDRLNAVTTDMLVDLTEAIGRAGEADAIVLSGTGRAFCTGADLSGGVDDDTVEAAARLVSLIASIDVPVIAAVNGPAAGVGASIALACDLVVAAESAFFLMPFLPLGLVPDGGATHLLVSAVGRARAARMVFGGERIPASTAFDWGLIGQVVADEELTGVVHALVLRLQSAPRRAVAESKRLLRASEGGAFEAALAAERAVQGELLASTQFTEARAAFLERSTVDFRGRR